MVLAISQATVLANPVAQDSVDFVAQYPEYASDLTNSVAQYADDSTTQCTRTSNAVSDQISVDENPAEDQILSILPRKTPDTACPAKGTFRFTPQGKPTLRPIFKFRKYREDRIHKLRRLQLKPDPFCKGHGSKKQLLTCGGPEIMGEYLSVVHCIRGKTSICLALTMLHTLGLLTQEFRVGMNPFVPTRGIWVATKKVALYCCQFFFDIVSVLFFFKKKNENKMLNLWSALIRRNFGWEIHATE